MFRVCVSDFFLSPLQKEKKRREINLIEEDDRVFERARISSYSRRVLSPAFAKTSLAVFGVRVVQGRVVGLVRGTA